VFSDLQINTPVLPNCDSKQNTPLSAGFIMNIRLFVTVANG
ncbi:MAG: hypothetical protein ACI832_003574, partial [Rheinheimera aquimaris]